MMIHQNQPHVRETLLLHIRMSTIGQVKEELAEAELFHLQDRTRRMNYCSKMSIIAMAEKDVEAIRYYTALADQAMKCSTNPRINALRAKLEELKKDIV